MLSLYRAASKWTMLSLYRATSICSITLHLPSLDPTQAVTMTTHPCTGSAPSPDAPSVTLTMCSALATPSNLSSHAFLHGDTYVIVISTDTHVACLDQSVHYPLSSTFSCAYIASSPPPGLWSRHTFSMVASWIF